MALDLADAHRRYLRAQKHVDRLHRQIREFIEGGPYAFARSFDAHESCHVFKTLELSVVPSLEMTLSEALHHMRAALDHIAWQAAVDNMGVRKAEKYRGDVGFPASITRDAFARSRLWPNIDRGRIPLFDTRQPYHGRDPKRQPLALLARFSNEDKHRSLHATTVTLGDPAPIFAITGEGKISRVKLNHRVPLKGNAEIARVWTAPSDADVNVEHIAIDISFGRRPYIYPTDVERIFGEVDLILKDFEQGWPAERLFD